MLKHSEPSQSCSVPSFSVLRLHCFSGEGRNWGNYCYKKVTFIGTKRSIFMDRKIQAKPPPFISDFSLVCAFSQRNNGVPIPEFSPHIYVKMQFAKTQTFHNLTRFFVLLAYFWNTGQSQTANAKGSNNLRLFSESTALFLWSYCISAKITCSNCVFPP